MAIDFVNGDSYEEMDKLSRSLFGDDIDESKEDEVDIKIRYLVEAAHTAGWMEARRQIQIENDEELAQFLSDIYDEWDSSSKSESFAEFSFLKIIEHYNANIYSIYSDLKRDVLKFNFSNYPEKWLKGEYNNERS